MNTTPQWRKSSHSAGSGESHCVELVDLAAAIGVRDSKDPEGSKLVLERREFGELVRAIKASY
ncbi:DUF397 domain-containing protein [Actinomadura rugatobispora]|uniref:DUF397 domain-containing protein n=1 Tax=Actinomadura rugatobispora TaxID=1994 RepID=A0ABW1AC11_9ACTN|nr:hypothetical protein GCM10010200_084590 [Actinomadura rugatobispora]